MPIETNLLGWSNKNSTKENYFKICELIATNDEYFKVFKKNKNYTPILEHVDYNLGNQYLNIILNDYNESILGKVLDRLEDIKENDRLGSPTVFNYPTVGVISPTTLRYIKVLMDILKLDFDLNGKSVVEIGGGYGGQALVLSKFFEFENYTILDLKTASMVQKRYLLEAGFSANTGTIDDFEERNYDFVISNYAFSEISKTYQDVYLDRVIRRSSSGYFQINPDASECYNHIEIREIFSSFPNAQFLSDYPMDKRYPNNFIFSFRETG
jgi:hypothetical protein